MLDERQLISDETIANTHQLKSCLRRGWGRGLEIGHPVKHASEHNLAKVRVGRSNRLARSKIP
jgi:hypothetical protein